LRARSKGGAKIVGRVDRYLNLTIKLYISVYRRTVLVSSNLTPSTDRV
jgi:hypothetical protein